MGGLIVDYVYIMYVFCMQYVGVYNIVDVVGLMGGFIVCEVVGVIFFLFGCEYFYEFVFILDLY